jgi:predicted nucleotidyltransferase
VSDQVTDEVRSIMQDAGLELAVLFGSATNDRLRADGDVDVGIRLPAAAESSLHDEARLALALGRVFGLPVTLGEIFDVLERHAVITAPTAQAMRSGTRLRNLVAHAYGDIDPARLHDAAAAGVGEIERFLAELGSWLEAAGG